MKRKTVDHVLELLHRLIARSNALENDPKEFGTGQPLHRAEIHTIQAVGQTADMNLQQLADRMGVTKGAASQMASRLEAKGLLVKAKAPGNAKEIRLELTDRGWTGYHAHERFHDYLYTVFQDHFGPHLEGKMSDYRGFLKELLQIVDLYEEKVRDI